MEKSTVQIRYNSEKLRTLREHMDEMELQTGLEAFMQTLYERYVPANARENIERKKEGHAV